MQMQAEINFKTLLYSKVMERINKELQFEMEKVNIDTLLDVAAVCFDPTSSHLVALWRCVVHLKQHYARSSIRGVRTFIASTPARKV